jgi:hypothetical protein
MAAPGLGIPSLTSAGCSGDDRDIEEFFQYLEYRNVEAVQAKLKQNAVLINTYNVIT